MKQKIVLLMSVVVGFIAFMLSSDYLRKERDKLYAGAEVIRVIIAGRDLPAGQVVALEDLALGDIFAKGVGMEVFREEDLNRIVGRRLNYSVRRGAPVTWHHIAVPEDRSRGLAAMITSGLRAVSIPISGAASVSGLVAPNDRVDILGTFTFPSKTFEGELESVTLTLLQDVTVLATGQRMARDTMMGDLGRGTAYSMITFEVTPRESELLVFAQHVKGQLHLSLRNTEDVGYEAQLPSVNFDHIETKLEEYNLYRQRELRNKREL